MNDIFVYRVENSKGEGMYTARGGVSLNHCPEYQHLRSYDDGDHDNHPIPTRKMIYAFEYETQFAFESIKSLYKWLYDSTWIKYLRENGFIVSKYKVEETYCDDHRQLVYSTKNAMLVSQLPLSIYGPAYYL